MLRPFGSALSPDQVIAAHEVPGAKNVFVLGCADFLRFTVSSQQDRAICLIESLALRKIVGRSKKVAIVGAGVAGATAAISALKEYAQVTLFERRSRPLQLFMHSHHRMLHPFLYDWPRQGWDQEVTTFPHLNWQFDSAASIARGMLDEFENFCLKPAYKKLFVPEYDCGDIALDLPAPANVKRWLIVEGKKCGPFDVIILAVGPGNDRVTNGIPDYWNGDTIENEELYKSTAYIAGTGDGAIIDSLRLRIVGFSERKIIQLLHSWKGSQNRTVINRILYFEGGELRAESDPSEVRDTYWNLLPKAEFIVDWMTKNLRPDTTLRLIGNGDSAYGRRVAPLNRLLLTCLFEAEQRKGRPIPFLAGPFERLDEAAGKRKLILGSSVEPIILGNQDRLFIRLPPESALSRVDQSTAATMAAHSEGIGRLDHFNGRQHLSLKWWRSFDRAKRASPYFLFAMMVAIIGAVWWSRGNTKSPQPVASHVRIVRVLAESCGVYEEADYTGSVQTVMRGRQGELIKENTTNESVEVRFKATDRLREIHGWLKASDVMEIH